MTLDIWTQQSGSSLGTYSERTDIVIDLPVINDTGVTYAIIAGELPAGLRISGNKIIGRSFLVPIDTTSIFCIRATKDNLVADRTFKITITGLNPPEFVLSSQNLDIGPAFQYFAIDNTLINYQLQAISFNISNNNLLTFYISAGTLPPGLTLSSNGLIYGVTNVLTTEFPDNLSFNYAFEVAITDGISVVKREYRIYVVGPEYLNADNNVLRDANGLFTADVTSLRPIQWITPSNLGKYRASNYVSIKLKTVNTIAMSYDIDDENLLPPGMKFDKVKGLLYGNVPYQPASEEQYSFTITATTTNLITLEKIQSSKMFTLTIVGEIDNYITWDEGTGSGAILIAELGYNNEHGLPQADQILNIKIVNGGSGYTKPPRLVIRPTNGGADAAAYCTILNGKIVSVVITYPGHGYMTAPNIDVAIDLGTIKADIPSNLSINANSSVKNSVIRYEIISGSLPPGLSLSDNGEIVGIVEKTVSNNQSFYANQIIFDGGTTIFDTGNTSVDKTYVFTISANNQYSISVKSFYLYVDTGSIHSYSNMYVKPMLTTDERNMWLDFINNHNLFDFNTLYRIADSSYGLQQDLKMLVFAGIETSLLDNYADIVTYNHATKKFLFGDVKVAIAADETTNQPLYEVVYIEMIDPLEPNGKHLPIELEFLGNTYYPDSITNWRDRIFALSDNQDALANDQSYLPLWMRTIQPTSNSILGFTLAVPICFCKTGYGHDIASKIANYLKSSGFSFNQIDYTVDRYIIDNVTDYTGNKYIVFKN